MCAGHRYIAGVLGLLISQLRGKNEPGLARRCAAGCWSARLRPGCGIVSRHPLIPRYDASGPATFHRVRWKFETEAAKKNAAALTDAQGALARCNSSPAVSGDAIIFGSTDGTLYAIQSTSSQVDIIQRASHVPELGGVQDRLSLSLRTVQPSTIAELRPRPRTALPDAR